MSAEEWRPVVGFPDYLVSDQGRVKSMKVWRQQQGRILRGHTAPFGYPCVQLYGAGRGARNRVARSIHSLVMEAFVGPRPEGMEICHNDGDPADSCLSNLRYDTHAANVADMLRHGTHPSIRITECVNGHPFDESNTHVDPTTGRRYCRACTRVNSRRYRARKALRAAGVSQRRAAA